MADIAGMIAAVKREIALRERCYPKWIASGRMKQAAADNELSAMRSVLDLLTAVQSWSAEPWQEPASEGAVRIYRAALGLAEDGNV